MILDRVRFSYTDLINRSEQNKSFWFTSQTNDVLGIKRKITELARALNWKILSLNGEERVLSIDDLDGLKRLPFDPMQTKFCDTHKPGCDVTQSDCLNRKFRYCDQMPIWEDEIPQDERAFDIFQNDNDFYHESEEEPVLFWDDDEITERQRIKYFFHEQLQILSSIISNSSEKVFTERYNQIAEYTAKINDWNTNFTYTFSGPETVPKCQSLKITLENQLKLKAQCNRWGQWEETQKCPICHQNAKFRKQRKCFSHSSKELATNMCGPESEVTGNCDNPNCTKNWGLWNHGTCVGLGHFRRTRQCYWRKDDQNIQRTSGCPGSSYNEFKWSSKCGVTTQWGDWENAHCGGYHSCHYRKSRRCFYRKNGSNIGTASTNRCSGSSNWENTWSQNCGVACSKRMENMLWKMVEETINPYLRHPKI